MFQETSRHNWPLFFHYVGVGANLFAGMWGETVSQSNCSSHYSWSLNQQMGSFPPFPPGCFLLQYQKQVLLVFVFTFPCIQTSTLKNPTSLAKAKASGKDPWSGAESSPESMVSIKTTQSPQDPTHTGLISARIHRKQAAEGSAQYNSLGALGLFPPKSYSLWLILPLVGPFIRRDRSRIRRGKRGVHEREW